MGGHARTHLQPLPHPISTCPPTPPRSVPPGCSEYLEKNFADTSGRDTLKLALKALMEVRAAVLRCTALGCGDGSSHRCGVVNQAGRGRPRPAAACQRCWRTQRAGRCDAA